MKVNVLAENINKALSDVSRVVSSKAALPVLSNILIEAKKEGLMVVGTDLEMGMRVKVGAKIVEEGGVGVPSRTLTEFLSTISRGVVEINTEGATVKVIADKVKATVAGVEASEFPVVPEFVGEAQLMVDWKAFAGAISQVLVATAKDDSRPILAGVLWMIEEGAKSKVLRLVATDGYRLGMDEVEILSLKEDLDWGQVVVPARALAELLRVGGKEGVEKLWVKLEKEKQQVIFKLGEVEVVSRLLAGEFPSYQTILPKDFSHTMVVNREELLEAVRRAAVFARDGANIVKMELGEGKVKVIASSTNLGGGETEIEATIEGEKMVVAFNSRYLTEYLSALSDEEVVFESLGSLKPGVFKLRKGRLVHLVMPLRLSE